MKVDENLAYTQRSNQYPIRKENQMYIVTVKLRDVKHCNCQRLILDAGKDRV